MFFSEKFEKGGRFERKFVIDFHSAMHVANVVKSHPACFTEIFSERKIHNIYLDTKHLNFFHDNTDGNLYRKKYRLRWYGYGAGKSPTNPRLEIKIKSGHPGTLMVFTPVTSETDFASVGLGCAA